MRKRLLGGGVTRFLLTTIFSYRDHDILVYRILQTPPIHSIITDKIELLLDRRHQRSLTCDYHSLIT